jgi:hypothetical protein
VWQGRRRSAGIHRAFEGDDQNKSEDKGQVFTNASCPDRLPRLKAWGLVKGKKKRKAQVMATMPARGALAWHRLRAKPAMGQVAFVASNGPMRSVAGIVSMQ